MKKIIPLKDNSYEVHISWSSKSNTPRITGTLYTAEGDLVKGINPKTRKAKSKKEIEYLNMQIVHAFEETLKPKATHRRVEKDNEDSNWTDPRLTEALSRLMESGRLRDDWAESTIDKYMAKFKRYILPCISPPEEFNKKKHKLLEEKIKESIERRARKSNGLNARKDTQVYLNAGQTIYELMQDIDPSLPNISLRSDSSRLVTKRREMPKHIPVDVQRKFEAEILAIINDDPIFARATAIMHSGATRNSEAASAIGSDFIINNEYIMLDIATQEISGVRNPELKTPASYRKVVFDNFGEFVVKEANKLIEITEDTELAPISSKKLSEKIKDLLIKCGLTEEYIKIATLDMEQYPDYDADGRPITDVTAYILRRNRASIWANYCGLSPAEIDYMLGHVRHAENEISFDAKDPLSFIKIAQKVKAVNFIDEFKSCSDSIIRIDSAEKRQISGNSTVKIINNTDEVVRVKLSLKTKEPGDCMTLITEGTVLACNRTSPSHSVRPSTTLIGHVQEGD